MTALNETGHSIDNKTTGSLKDGSDSRQRRPCLFISNVMQRGYVKLWRKLEDSEIIEHPGALQLFIYLTIKANITDKEWRGIDVKRGQLITSRMSLSVALKQNQNTIYKRLHWLKTRNMISVAGNNKHTKITICEYNRYQENINVGQQQSNNKVTARQQQSNTTKELKALKHEKKTYTRQDNCNDLGLIEEIVNYLNKKLGSGYRDTSEKTRQLIRARLKEKFTVDNFKTVIDKKNKSWTNDPKMSKFLRPETLFGNKFEGYLNEKETNGTNQTNSQSDLEFNQIGEKYKDL